jgi:hypothetical protein
MDRARMLQERSGRVGRWFCFPQISLFRHPFGVFPQPVKAGAFSVVLLAQDRFAPYIPS